MNFLDLCAGIGGFSLGLEWAGMTCAGQVEIDDYCNKVLEKHWPDVPRWRDLKTVNPADLPAVELICGGYPCQPFSHAGLRRGQEDDRHLWPYILPIVAQVRPAWCLFENVAGHVSMGLDAVLADLENIGYSARPVVVPACAVDAPHRRDRVWIIAVRTEQPIEGTDATLPASKDVPNADRERCQEQRISVSAKQALGGTECSGRRPTKPGVVRMVNGIPAALDGTWRPEPNIPRVARGVPNRVTRLKALGNAVVPQVVAEIGRAIMAAENKMEVR